MENVTLLLEIVREGERERLYSWSKTGGQDPSPLILKDKISVCCQLNSFTLSGPFWAEGSQPYTSGGKKSANNLREVSLYSALVSSLIIYFGFWSEGKKFIFTAGTINIAGMLDMDGIMSTGIVNPVQKWLKSLQI